MNILPPGTILQLMYLKERLKALPPGRFVEIGPGAGHISALLLELGWSGVSFDLEPSTIAELESRFAREIGTGRYRPVVGDWLASANEEQFDLVLSCMVLEHFDEEGESLFVDVAKRKLSPQGVMITIVPGSPAHWGIEDEIAGHYRRYCQSSAKKLFESAGWNVRHIAGLTFPVSNIVYPLSNYLVRRSEARKMSLSMVERTKQSGIRNVPMKTTFPKVFGLLLNEVVMYPFHLVQKIFRRSKRSMVLYIEATPLPAA